MTADGSCHQAKCEQRTECDGAWREQQQHGNEFRATRRHAAPGLRAERGEDEFRFRRATELETERLGQYRSGDELENPARDGVCSAIVHDAPRGLLAGNLL